MNMCMRRDLNQMNKDNATFNRIYRDLISKIETHI